MASTEYRSDDEMLQVVVARASAITADRARRRKQRVLSIAAVVVVVLAVAGVLRWDRLADRGGRVDVAAVGDTPDGGWTPMAASPLSPRARPVTVWTGLEMIVWGGEGRLTDVCPTAEDGTPLCGDPSRSEGAAYSPSTDTWRLLAEPPIYKEKGSGMYGSMHRGVWTGTEMIVWGGSKAEGAAYNPETNSWRKIASGPLAARARFTMTWTGREVIVFGGNTEGPPSDRFADGAIYDPERDEWRRIASASGGRSEHSSVWVDGRLVVLGGIDGDKTSSPAVAYDPSTDTWTTLPTPPVDVRKAVVVGGTVFAFGYGDGIGELAGASFDPAENAWTRLPASPPAAIGPGDVVSTDEEIIVMPEIGIAMDPASDVPPAAAFDPTSGAWRTLPDNGLSLRRKSAIVWTGSEILVWGGSYSGGFTAHPFGDGARYRPGTKD